MLCSIEHDTDVADKSIGLTSICDTIIVAIECCVATNRHDTDTRGNLNQQSHTPGPLLLADDARYDESDSNHTIHTSRVHNQMSSVWQISRYAYAHPRESLLPRKQKVIMRTQH